MTNEKSGDPNWAWWQARSLVTNYLSNAAPFRDLTVNEANFEALLEKHLIESGKGHAFMRQAFSTENGDLDVDIIDFVNEFAKDFVNNGMLKNE